jgi:hypothetical protein
VRTIKRTLAATRKRYAYRLAANSARSRTAGSSGGKICWSKSSRSHNLRRPSFALGCGYSFQTLFMKASTESSP